MNSIKTNNITIDQVSQYSYELKLVENKKENMNSTIFLKSIIESNNISETSSQVFSTCNDRENAYSSFLFHASSVKLLTSYLNEEKMNYNSIILMMSSLYKQQLYLEKRGFGFYAIDINDILLIDDKYFLYTNIDSIMSMNIKERKYYFYFNKLFSRNCFVSPEILSIQTIPVNISYKCFYYSLGALALYCLFQLNISTLSSSFPVDEKYMVYQKVIDILKPVSQTKLYWCILKCLCIDIERRNFLFI